jgi:hypothetical protein
MPDADALNSDAANNKSLQPPTITAHRVTVVLTSKRPAANAVRDAITSAGKRLQVLRN